MALVGLEFRLGGSVTPAVGKSEANRNTKLNTTNTLYLVEVFLDHSLAGNSVLVSICLRTAFYRYVLDIYCTYGLVTEIHCTDVQYAFEQRQVLEISVTKRETKKKPAGHTVTIPQ